MGAAGASVSPWVGEGEDAGSRTRVRAIQETTPSDNQVEKHLAERETHRAAYRLDLMSLRAVGFKGLKGRVQRSFVGQAALMGNAEAVRVLLRKLREEGASIEPISWTGTYVDFLNKVILRSGATPLKDYFKTEEDYEGCLRGPLAAPGTFSLGHVLAYFGMDGAFQVWLESRDVRERGIQPAYPSLAWMVYWGEGGTEAARSKILRTLQRRFEKKDIPFERQKAHLTGPFYTVRIEGSKIKGPRKIDLLPAYEGVRRHGRPRLWVFLATQALLEGGETALAAASSSAGGFNLGRSALPISESQISESLEIWDAERRTPLHWLVEEAEATQQALLQVFYEFLGPEEFQLALKEQNEAGVTPWHLFLSKMSPDFLKRLWGLHEGMEFDVVEKWCDKSLDYTTSRSYTPAFLSLLLPPASSPPVSGASAASAAASPVEVPLVHEAFLVQAPAKFRDFEDSFQGFLDLADRNGETLFHKGAHAYKASPCEALYEKFRFALQKIGATEVDSILGQGGLLHVRFQKDRPSVWEVLGEPSGIQRERDPLRWYVENVEDDYHLKLKAREERAGRKTIEGNKRLKAFDDAFYGMSQRLFTAQQVLATGMVTREETGVERAVGYIKVVGEIIPVPGAAVMGRILSAAGKGYFTAREDGRIEGVATRHARSEFEALSQEMTLALKDPLEGLTPHSAETLGEVLGSWFLTREPEATEFPFIEGLIVDLFKGRGLVDRWTTPLLLRQTPGASPVSLKTWTERLGIRDKTSKEWHRKGTPPLAYIEGREEQATELGFVDKAGHPATQTIQTGKEASEPTHAGGAAGLAGLEAAAQEPAVQRLAETAQDRCCSVQ